jgi:hypothetical protein
VLAGERIGGIPAVLQRLEAHRARVEHDQPADQALAETDDLADDLKRHQRAEHAGERAENAGLCASRHRAGRRGLGKQAAIGRVARAVRSFFVRANSGEGAVEDADGGGDQGLLRKEASIGDEIARGEVVGAVGDDVVAADQLEGVGRGEPRCMGLDRDMGIEATNRRRRAFGF